MSGLSQYRSKAEIAKNNNRDVQDHFVLFVYYSFVLNTF